MHVLYVCVSTCLTDYVFICMYVHVKYFIHKHMGCQCPCVNRCKPMLPVSQAASSMDCFPWLSIVAGPAGHHYQVDTLTGRFTSFHFQFFGAHTGQQYVISEEPLDG